MSLKVSISQTAGKTVVSTADTKVRRSCLPLVDLNMEEKFYTFFA